MTPARLFSLMGTTTFALLHAAPSVAQAAEACGSKDDLLFYCTFDGGAKQVGLCHNDGMISYAFGPDFTKPELQLVNLLKDVDYTPFSWASGTIWVGITLTNVDTRYEVFASAPRGPDPDVTEGGITVTLPNGHPTTLRCDAGSVWPRDPLEGIGQLSGS